MRSATWYCPMFTQVVVTSLPLSMLWTSHTALPLLHEGASAPLQRLEASFGCVKNGIPKGINHGHFCIGSEISCLTLREFEYLV